MSLRKKVLCEKVAVDDWWVDGAELSQANAFSCPRFNHSRM